MKGQKITLYKMKDTYPWDDADLTFELASDIDPVTLQKIVAVSKILFNDAIEDTKINDTIETELLQKYSDLKDLNISEYEIIKNIVENEGYLWNEIEYVEIEW